nr:MAG TPA: hypothetical protein [Caudoviricetes sp.]
MKTNNIYIRPQPYSYKSVDYNYIRENYLKEE